MRRDGARLRFNLGQAWSSLKVKQMTFSILGVTIKTSVLLEH